MHIFKILTGDQWRAFDKAGQFEGAPVDLADGYIHLSTAEQVEETARKHFTHLADLVLVAINPAQLGAALRYEASRGGDLFPHYYGVLRLSDIGWAKPLPIRTHGTHDFTGLLV